MSEKAEKVLTEEEVRTFLSRLGVYVLLVQNETHARRARVAMFWSFVSLLFIFGIFEITPSEKNVGILGLSFRDLTEEKVSWFLFGITLYYAARFFFSVAKIWKQESPFAMLDGVHDYAKCRKLVLSPHDFYKRERELAKSLEKPIGDAEKLLEMMSYNVLSRYFGVWENFVFRMFFPMKVCIFSLSVLVGQVASY